MFHFGNPRTTQIPVNDAVAWLVPSLIVRCSHIARHGCPRLVILHCSSTSIFKSVPPPPCPFLSPPLHVLFLPPFRAVIYRYKSPRPRASSQPPPDPTPFSSIIDGSIRRFTMRHCARASLILLPIVADPLQRSTRRSDVWQVPVTRNAASRKNVPRHDRRNTGR